MLSDSPNSVASFISYLWRSQQYGTCHMRSCHPTTHNIPSQLLEHRDPSFHKLPKRLGVQLLLDTRCLSATSNVIEDDSWVVLKSMWVLVYMVSFENAQNINDYRISPSFCAMIAISFVLHLLSTLLVYFLEPVVWPISKWLLNRIHTGGIEFCATHFLCLRTEAQYYSTRQEMQRKQMDTLPDRKWTTHPACNSRAKYRSRRMVWHDVF